MSTTPQIRSGYDPYVSGYLDLRAYANVVRRSARLIILFVVLGVGLAAAYSFTRTPLYTATTHLQVKPTGVNLIAASEFGLDKILNMPTQAEFAKSLPVAKEAAQDIGFQGDPLQLLKRVRVEVPEESQVLVISCTFPSPTEAQECALAFATEFLEVGQEKAEQDINPRIAQQELLLEDLSNRLNDAAGRGPGSGLALEAQIVAAIEKLNDLNDINVDPGDLSLPPALPTRPSSPNHPLNLGLGLFAGLALGVGISFVRHQTDDRLRERSQLEEVLSAPVMAMVPRDPFWQDRDTPKLVALEEPRSPVAEAYRSLRTTVLASAARRGIKTIVVTSPLAGEGKSTTAANLAVVMAQADRRVALISADLRKPRAHKFFGLRNEDGLSEVLAGHASAREALKRTQVENLWFMASGTEPVHPAELLQSKAMEELIEEQRDIMDFIIIDCPPVLAVADMLGLVPFADGVLFVADATISRMDAIEQASERLRQMGAPMMGAVLNDFDLTTSAYYYGYGYGGHDGSGSAPSGNGRGGPAKQGRRKAANGADKAARASRARSRRRDRKRS